MVLQLVCGVVVEARVGPVVLLVLPFADLGVHSFGDGVVQSLEVVRDDVGLDALGMPRLGVGHVLLRILIQVVVDNV